MRFWSIMKARRLDTAIHCLIEHNHLPDAVLVHSVRRSTSGMAAMAYPFAALDDAAPFRRISAETGPLVGRTADQSHRRPLLAFRFPPCRPWGGDLTQAFVSQAGAGEAVEPRSDAPLADFRSRRRGRIHAIKCGGGPADRRSSIKGATHRLHDRGGSVLILVHFRHPATCTWQRVTTASGGVRSRIFPPLRTPSRSTIPSRSSADD